MLCPTNGLHQPEHWPRLLHVVISGFPAAEEGQPNAQALSKPPQASHVLTNHWPKPAIGTKLKPKDCRIKLYLLMAGATKYCGQIFFSVFLDRCEFLVNT